MIYNFMPQFVAPIRSGAKCQTIRARGKRRPPRIGEALQLYTGLRTRSARRICTDVTCSAVELISIGARMHEVQMIRHNQWWLLDAEDVDALAKADGFTGADDFFLWFEANHGATFSGYVIKWD